MIYSQKRLIAFLAVAFLLVMPVGLSLAEKAATPAPKTAVAGDETSAQKLQEVEKKLVRIETIIEERGKDARLSAERIQDLEKIKSDQARLREKAKWYHSDIAKQIFVGVMILVIAAIILAVGRAILGRKAPTDEANEKTLKEAQAAVDKVNKRLKEITETHKNAQFSKDHIDDLRKKALLVYTDLSKLYEKANAAQEKPSKPIEEIEQEQKFSKDFEQLAKISDVPLPASHYFNLAYNSAALGKHEKAIEFYTKAIKLKPDYAEAYNNRANLFRKLGKDGEAMQGYNKAIKLKPDYAMAYNNRGFLFATLGKYEEAMQNFTKAIKLEPNLAMAYGNRYLLHKKLGNKKEAASDYNKAIELDPRLKDKLEDPDK